MAALDPVLLIQEGPLQEEGSAKIGGFLYTLAGLSSFIGCAVAMVSIFSHLKNYRRPDLQRYTIRILWMVPVYAVASFISLSSRYLSDYIDTIRDLYEAFVIYTFFNLLINYLGGERAVLVMLEERMRTHHMWPFNLCFSPMDMSDPDTFLFVRRGILQFVVIKPILALFIMLLKVTGFYTEGYITWDSSYLWISLLYNISVCTAMYCLVMFYLQCAPDLRPYRPFPKFVCIKAIIFFSFWQGLLIAFLVKIGAIRDKGVYDANNIATAIQDLLICLEMVPFSIMHWYAFSWTDFDDSRLSSRVSLLHSVRDAFGVKDIVQDTYHTFRGTTFKSIRTTHDQRLERECEDNEANFVLGGERRFYDWSRTAQTSRKRKAKKKRVVISDQVGYAPVPDMENGAGSGSQVGGSDEEDDSEDERMSLEFPDVEEEQDIEEAYRKSREFVFGDFNFPVLHEDPRFREPPEVQKAIAKKASHMSLDNKPGGGPKAGELGGGPSSSSAGAKTLSPSRDGDGEGSINDGVAKKSNLRGAEFFQISDDGQ